MARLARSRLRHLELRINVGGPPLGRQLFLIPDLWPKADQEAFHHPASQEALAELIERRTGVRPTFGMEPPIWAITVPASDEMLAMSDTEKVAFLERHESRPLRLDHWEWQGAADDGRGDGA